MRTTHTRLRGPYLTQYVWPKYLQPQEEVSPRCICINTSVLLKQTQKLYQFNSLLQQIYSIQYHDSYIVIEQVLFIHQNNERMIRSNPQIIGSFKQIAKFRESTTIVNLEKYPVEEPPIPLNIQLNLENCFIIWF